MSNILVCRIFRRTLLVIVAADYLANGTFLAVLETLEDIVSPLVEEVGWVVSVNHLHDLAADAGVDFGQAELESADVAARLTAEPFLQLVGVHTGGVNVVSGPAGPAETDRHRVSKEG